MIIRARAPLRISFGGGGTDVPPYCDEHGGVVLSASVNRYACASIRPGGDCFTVRSLDYDAVVSYGISDPFIYDGQLDLAKATLNYFRQTHKFSQGLDIFLHNDAPPGSGLGSSSAITVALIVAVAEYLRLPLDKYQIAELAYQVERKEAGIEGGKQDQYASAFGGFSFIEFSKEGTVVNSLRLHPETVCELEYSLVFAYIGGQRFSARIIERQVENYRQGRGEVLQAMDRLKELACEMKKVLLKGKLYELGILMNEAWKYKKRLAQSVTNERIEEIYHEARKAGALGGKISGAGGGGFMFFMCDPRHRFSVQERLKQLDVQLVNFSFVEEGARAWMINDGGYSGLAGTGL